MSSVERENAELKRRIELISNLRGLNHIKKPQNDELSKSRSDSILCQSIAVDSAWSQAQAFGDSASS